MLSDSLPQVGRSTRAARWRGHEGLLPDRYRADGERCRARPRDATFDVLGFCGGIRASVSVLRSSRSALTRLRTRYEPSTDPFLRCVTVLSPRLCCGGRVRTGNPP